MSLAHVDYVQHVDYLAHVDYVQSLRAAREFNYTNIHAMFEQQLEHSKSVLSETLDVADNLLCQDKADTFEYETTQDTIKRLTQTISELTEELQMLAEEKKPPEQKKPSSSSSSSSSHKKPSRQYKRKAPYAESIRINRDMTDDRSPLPVREAKK
jgi:rubrerythrin